MPDWRDIYQLTYAQASNWHDIIDIYSPASSAPSIPGQRGKPRSYDMTTPTWAGVRCRYKTTPDFQMVALGGQMTEDNIMTQDNFFMHFKQPCAADWKIVLRTILPDGSRHVLYGHVWEVQGEGKPDSSLGGWVKNSNLIYAKQGPGMD